MNNLHEYVNLIMKEVNNLTEASNKVEAATNDEKIPFSSFIKLVTERDCTYTKCVNTISEILKSLLEIKEVKDNG